MEQIVIVSIDKGYRATVGQVTGEAATPEHAIFLSLLAAGLVDNRIEKRLPTEQEILTTPYLLNRMVELARANDSLEEDLPNEVLNSLMPALDEQLELFSKEFPQFEVDWRIVTDIKALLAKAH